MAIITGAPTACGFDAKGELSKAKTRIEDLTGKEREDTGRSAATRKELARITEATSAEPPKVKIVGVTVSESENGKLTGKTKIDKAESSELEDMQRAPIMREVAKIEKVLSDRLKDSTSKLSLNPVAEGLQNAQAERLEERVTKVFEQRAKALEKAVPGARKAVGSEQIRDMYREIYTDVARRIEDAKSKDTPLGSDEVNALVRERMNGVGGQPSGEYAARRASIIKGAPEFEAQFVRRVGQDLQQAYHESITAPTGKKANTWFQAKAVVDREKIGTKQFRDRFDALTKIGETDNPIFKAHAPALQHSTLFFVGTLDEVNQRLAEHGIEITSGELAEIAQRAQEKFAGKGGTTRVTGMDMFGEQLVLLLDKTQVKPLNDPIRDALTDHLKAKRLTDAQIKSIVQEGSLFGTSRAYTPHTTIAQFARGAFKEGTIKKAWEFFKENDFASARDELTRGVTTTPVDKENLGDKQVIAEKKAIVDLAFRAFKFAHDNREVTGSVDLQTVELKQASNTLVTSPLQTASEGLVRPKTKSSGKSDSPEPEVLRSAWIASQYAVEGIGGKILEGQISPIAKSVNDLLRSHGTVSVGLAGTARSAANVRLSDVDMEARLEVQAKDRADAGKNIAEAVLALSTAEGREFLEAKVGKNPVGAVNDHGFDSSIKWSAEELRKGEKQVELPEQVYKIKGSKKASVADLTFTDEEHATDYAKHLGEVGLKITEEKFDESQHFILQKERDFVEIKTTSEGKKVLVVKLEQATQHERGFIKVDYSAPLNENSDGSVKVRKVETTVILNAAFVNPDTGVVDRFGKGRGATVAQIYYDTPEFPVNREWLLSRAPVVTPEAYAEFKKLLVGNFMNEGSTLKALKSLYTYYVVTGERNMAEAAEALFRSEAQRLNSYKADIDHLRTVFKVRAQAPGATAKSILGQERPQFDGAIFEVRKAVDELKEISPAAATNLLAKITGSEEALARIESEGPTKTSASALSLALIELKNSVGVEVERRTQIFISEEAQKSEAGKKIQADLERFQKEASESSQTVDDAAAAVEEATGTRT